MEGVIVSYRGSRRSRKMNHMIVQVNNITTKDKAANLVGKSVVWKSPAGKELKGKVGSAHGNSGALRIVFETGMPGQSLGQKVNIE